MTKFTVQAVATRAFAIASFALATLPVAAVAIASQAHAAVPEAHIQVGDLNLSNPAQVQVFEARLEKASHKVCQGYLTVRGKVTYDQGCIDKVRAEAISQLSPEQKVALVTASSERVASSR